MGKSSSKNKLNLIPISTGFFWGDAGIVFGNLPKTVYNKIAKPDADNRVKLYLNSLLIETDNNKIIIDPGLGALANHLKLENQSYHIKKKLTKLGISCDEITHVIITHLHPDHCGGLIVEGDSGTELTFPKAEIILSKLQWEIALNPDQLNKHQYPIKPILRHLKDYRKLTLVEDSSSILDFIEIIQSGGHCDGLLTVIIDSGKKEIIFASDLIPTRKHNNLTIYSSQDISKKESFFYRKILFQQMTHNSEFYYYHDENPADTL